MYYLVGLCILFFIITIILAVKICFLKRAAKEISEGFAEKLNTDTNTLIDISSSDREMRLLADSVNKQLMILRREHHRYIQGDKELKAAVTNISHDLRTPLTAICGYLDVMKRMELPEKIEQYLSIIADRAELMKQLTEELFGYSVILLADGNSERQELCVNQVLEDSIMGYYAAMTEKGITPNVRITERKIVKTLNRAELSRVFSNLLNNAIKYSDGDLEITLSDDGTVTFANTARNLDPVQVERLFDRFYTVEAARNSTGLGLSIAKTLVEQSGGRITAEYSANRLVITIVL
ncbi:MAG: HAMP domain-containing histidine kinase [Oscillospiraceae bacterium]|nr:HAMP domain-containing histidine kinase [Oscillospiraceae bacterium]